MTALQLTQVINALMSVGIQYLTLRRMMSKLQEVQEQGRELTDAEFQEALQGMDEADANLARAIAERSKR